MYTQCPECKTPSDITVKQLREQRAIVYCPNCGIKYDGLELLSDGAPPEIPAGREHPAPRQTPEHKIALVDYAPEIVENNDPLPWEQQTPAADVKFWTYGVISGLLLLLVQISYFERQRILRHPGFRPLLAQLCDRFGCQLEVYSDPNAFTVLHGSLKPLPSKGFRFQAAFTNKAPMAQPYPKIKLTLLTLDGDVFAFRIFDPQEYLRQTMKIPLVGADQTVEIHLSIAEPVSSIGGYTFEFI